MLVGSCQDRVIVGQHRRLFQLSRMSSVHAEQVMHFLLRDGGKHELLVQSLIRIAILKNGYPIFHEWRF